MAAFPEPSTVMWLQQVHPLGLVGLDERGGLFQPEFYESMVLSLQSGVKHKQAFLLREMLHVFSHHPVIWPSAAGSLCPTGMTAGAQPSVRAHSNCWRFRFYRSLLAPLLSYQT